MIYLFLYKSEEQVINLNYIKKKNSLLVVAPDPAHADDFRDHMSVKREETKKEAKKNVRDLSFNCEIITVSNFLKTLLRDQLNLSLDGKSDILLRLGIEWGHGQLRFISYEFFLQCYRFFSEIRSYTNNQDIIDEVLNELPEDLKKGIYLMIANFKKLNLVDETEAYSRLNVEKNQILKYEEVIFFGFKHLNGHQIDFIKNIGKHVDVYIPFPLDVYQKTSGNDWIRWFSDSSIEIIDDLEDDRQKNSENKPADVILFNKGGMSDWIKEIAKVEDKKKKKIIWGCWGDLDEGKLLNIPLYPKKNHLSIDLFSPTINLIYDQILEELIPAQLIFPLFNNHLQDKFQEILKNKKNDFLKIKVFLMFYLAFKDIEKQECGRVVTFFDLNLVKNIVELNSARLFLTSIPDESFSIMNLENIICSEVKKIDQKILIINGSVLESLKFDDIFSAKVKKIIAAVAPIKTSSLMELMWVDKISRILKDGDMTLLIEEDIEKHYPIIKKIMGLSNQIEKRQLIFSQRPFFDYDIKIKENVKIDFFSPTRIEAYLDCPRKFYWNYIEKINRRVILEKNVLTSELGTIEHEIVERYLIKYWGFHQENLRDFIGNYLDSYLIRENKKISPMVRFELETEFYYFAKNGIEQINEICLKSKVNDRSIVIEKELFNDYGHYRTRGRFDLCIRDKKTIFLFDLKRGSVGVPTALEIQNFDDIQLWFYLSRMGSFEEITYGYICLKDKERSKVYTTSEDNFLQTKVEKISKKEFTEKIQDYQKFEQSLIHNIMADEKFEILPKNKNSCEFCSAKVICPRSDF